ncbi:MAG: enoyl-CoA hydratase/isomerase family protein [Thermomicrobiales bacterium]|jgi:enoyl-CoA hydratase|nr:enoyl-CoA hydratase/isomerase family protein [Thermomicrobiales bacterium]
MAVDISTRNSVAIITMSRPEALNAFNVEQIQAVIDAFAQVNDRADIRSIVLTGEGERAFAAGADIKHMVDLDGAGGAEFGRLGHALTRAVAESRQPVIAAVNGFALGGGCEVAIAADIRFASPNAVFAQPEVGLGIPPGWGGTQRLPRLVGPGMAAEMILSGRRVGADEALRIGLVNAIHPLETLVDASVELAAQIAANSPRAVAAARDLMKLAFNGQTASGLATEAELFGETFNGPDQKEGMRAFVEKRKPVFEN